VALLEPETFRADVDGDGVVQQPVEDGGGDDRISPRVLLIRPEMNSSCFPTLSAQNSKRMAHPVAVLSGRINTSHCTYIWIPVLLPYAENLLENANLGYAQPRHLAVDTSNPFLRQGKTHFLFPDTSVTTP